MIAGRKAAIAITRGISPIRTARVMRRWLRQSADGRLSATTLAATAREPASSRAAPPRSKRSGSRAVPAPRVARCPSLAALGLFSVCPYAASRPPPSVVARCDTAETFRRAIFSHSRNWVAARDVRRPAREGGGMADSLDPESVRDSVLAGSRLWSRVSVVAETGSTNADLVSAAYEGAAEGTVLVAERQHAGRGRLGRPWIAEPGAALTLSV